MKTSLCLLLGLAVVNTWAAPPGSSSTEDSKPLLLPSLPATPSQSATFVSTSCELAPGISAKQGEAGFDTCRADLQRSNQTNTSVHSSLPDEQSVHSESATLQFGK